MNLNGLEHLITVDPDISWGTPVFRGTRVAVQTLFDYLEGPGLEDFLFGFPTVSREQAEAVIKALIGREGVGNANSIVTEEQITCLAGLVKKDRGALAKQRLQS